MRVCVITRVNPEPFLVTTEQAKRPAGAARLRYMALMASALARRGMRHAAERMYAAACGMRTVPKSSACMHHAWRMEAAWRSRACTHHTAAWRKGGDNDVNMAWGVGLARQARMHVTHVSSTPLGASGVRKQRVVRRSAHDGV